MSGQSHAGPPAYPATATPAPTTTGPQTRVSRRSVLRGAAGVGAVGLAAAVGSGATAAILAPRSGGEPAAAATSGAASAGPIVIYLHDPRTGEMDIFAGTSQVRRRDRAMAARMASMAPR